jgi:excisionase family DNA binding protein
MTTHENKKDAALAKESSHFLSSYLRSMHKKAIELKFVDKNGKLQKIMVPRSAVDLLASILKKMAEGSNVQLHSIRSELTTQQAADLLNVSRPFLIKLLESGKIPHRKVGTRRKILSKDILKYKEKMDHKRRESLDELVARSQELDLGYE